MKLTATLLKTALAALLLVGTKVEAQTLTEFQVQPNDTYRNLQDIVRYKGNVVLGEYYHGHFGRIPVYAPPTFPMPIPAPPPTIVGYQDYFENASSRVFFLSTDGAIVRSFTMPQLGSAIHTIAADEANNRVLILHTVPPAGTSSVDGARRDVYISTLADDGTLTNYLVSPSGSMVGWYYSLVIGPDNNIWYSEYDYHRIGRLNPSTGQVTYFQLATRTFPTEIIVGPDNNLWFLEWGGTGIGKLARMTAAGVLTEFAIPGLTAGCGPRGLSADEFSLWIPAGCYNSPKLARFKMSDSTISTINLTAAYNRPTSGTASKDGRVWIGTLAPGISGANASSEISQSRTAQGVLQMAMGPDGRAWGIEYSFKVARLELPPAVTITTNAIGAGKVEVPFTASIAASGGSPAYSFSLFDGALPPGLTLAADGTLSGTPTVAGNFAFTVAAFDSLGVYGKAAFTVEVAEKTPVIVAKDLGGIVWKVRAEIPLTSSPCTDAPGTKYVVTSGKLPLGLTLTGPGVIRGVPKEGGDFSFTVTVYDKKKKMLSEQLYSLYVSDLAIATKQLDIVLSPSAQSKLLTVTGGRAEYVWALVGGTLPGTLVLSPSGELSGVWAKEGKRMPGAVRVDVSVKDGKGFTVYQTVLLRPRQ